MEKTLAQHPSPAHGLGLGGGGGSSHSSTSSLAHSGSIPAALAHMEKGTSGSAKHSLHHHESTTPAGAKDITTGKLTYLLDQMK